MNDPDQQPYQMLAQMVTELQTEFQAALATGKCFAEAKEIHMRLQKLNHLLSTSTIDSSNETANSGSSD